MDFLLHGDSFSAPAHSNALVRGYSLLCVAVVQFTGIRGIDLNSRLLGVLMCLELGILLLLAIAIVVHGGGPNGLTLAAVHAGTCVQQYLGIAVMFAFASFIGFEATAIYGRNAGTRR